MMTMLCIKENWQQALCRFAQDTAGTIAVIFALFLIPIMLAASIALDMSSASEMKTEMQAAADSAVLAAATRLAVNASNADKEELALDTFYANLSPALAEHAGTPAVDIDFPAKQVHLAVDVEAANILSSLASENIMLHVEATATVSPGTAICLLALNPHVEQSLTIQGTADLMANECAVHVNSDDADDALHQQGSATATAESFCVHGGHYGSSFNPAVKDKCMVENDPLASSFASDWAAAGIDSMACTFSNLPQINTGVSTVTVLVPGVYCGGLTIKKGIVQLLPGQMYVFRNGPLHVQAQGTLKGTQTPILFHGNNTTRLITQAGAKVITSARTSGLFKGIAFAQHPSSIPTAENLIIGGGQMEIQGILYFPKQKLKITGNGDIGATVAQFAIIADTIAIEGNGQLNIHIGQNYQSSGLPDLPEAHEIVHLIQ
jgi:putative Flp pilus-assembly TadE/G-like protein